MALVTHEHELSNHHLQFNKRTLFKKKKKKKLWANSLKDTQRCHGWNLCWCNTSNTCQRHFESISYPKQLCLRIKHTWTFAEWLKFGFVSQTISFEKRTWNGQSYTMSRTQLGDSCSKLMNEIMFHPASELFIDCPSKHVSSTSCQHSGTPFSLTQPLSIFLAFFSPFSIKSSTILLWLKNSTRSAHKDHNLQ